MDTYAMQACYHMQHFGTTQRQIAAAAAKTHGNGALNPRAQYRFTLSVEEVLNDREISFPLTRAMCAPIGDGAAAALHHAAEIAHWADATIQVLYVADTARDSVTVVEGHVVDTLVQQGEDIVSEAAKTLDTLGVSYTTDVVQGNPAPTIVDYAERYDHDLVAMATHARTGVRRYLLGSVTEKVVRTSDVPVLTVRMDA